MSGIRLCAIVGFLLTFCLVRTPARASALQNEDLLNQPITAVRLEAGGRVETDPLIDEIVETRVGEPLRMAEVRETLAHLYGLGRFQDIRVHATRSPGGVALRYEMILQQTVRNIEFSGTTGIGQDELRRAVVDRFSGSPSIGRAAEAARTLVALYRDRGYMRATVAPEIRADRDPQRATLVFHVTPGPRATVSRITIEGNPLLPQHQFLAKIKLAEGQPYERPALIARLSEYGDELRHRGYYEARVEHTATIGEDDQTAGVTVTVDPGAHFQVVFEGDPLPSQQRDDLVPVEREGSADEDLLEDSNRRIETYLQGQGYRDAVSENTRSGDEREQKIVFTIRRGTQYRVGTVDIAGNANMEAHEAQTLLRVASGDAYVQSAINDGLGRIAEAYRRRGYAAVDIKAQAPPAPGQSSAVNVRIVNVAIQIVEGTATRVSSVVFHGNEHLDSRVLAEGLASQPGKPFYRPQLSTDLDGIVLKYLNRGYQTATADAGVTFNDDHSQAYLTVVVKEGPQVFIDHILIVGNNRTRAATIQRELAVKSGQPLGLEDVVESQRRLSALGLFRRARITELRHAGSETQRDLLVTVEEAPLTTIGYGVGVEGGRFLRRVAGQEGAVEVFEAAPRGFFEIGRRNLWGKNRSVNLFSRVSFRQNNGAAGDPSLPIEESGYGFNEYRVLFTYREPKVFGSPADGLVSAFTEQGVRSSFNFNRKGMRGELARRFPSRISLSGRYDFDTTRLFDERIRPADKPLIDRLFPQVRLSSVSGSFIRDSRDDGLDPGSGELVGLDAQLAARRMGSEVGFFKTFMQAFVYRRLPGKKRIVLAAGARLGLANGFPQEVARVDDNGQPLFGPDGRPLTVTVEDIPASERFFAGGDTTVRGFALDRLGTPETFDQDGFPVGGHALVIFNTELRVPVWRDIGVVGFVDSGNVFEFVGDLDLSRVRGAAGFGLRYKSPIGPLRIDLGFKLDRQEFADGQLEKRTALHISLGQAF